MSSDNVYRTQQFKFSHLSTSGKSLVPTVGAGRQRHGSTDPTNDRCPRRLTDGWSNS